MLTLIFMVLLFGVFGKLMVLSVKAAWGITRIVLNLVLFPIVLVVLVIGGLLYIAFPVLIIAGIIVLIRSSKI